MGGRPESYATIFFLCVVSCTAYSCIAGECESFNNQREEDNFASLFVQITVTSQTFFTTRHTLLKDGSMYFKDLLDKSDHIFLDRNAAYFAAVMDILQYEDYRVPPGLSELRLIDELVYYDLLKALYLPLDIRLFGHIVMKGLISTKETDESLKLGVWAKRIVQTFEEVNELEYTPSILVFPDKDGIVAIAKGDVDFPTGIYDTSLRDGCKEFETKLLALIKNKYGLTLTIEKVTMNLFKSVTKWIIGPSVSSAGRNTNSQLIGVYKFTWILSFMKEAINNK